MTSAPWCELPRRAAVVLGGPPLERLLTGATVEKEGPR